MIGGKLNKNRCGKDKSIVCNRECISKYGIFHCDSNDCIYCDAEPGSWAKAQQFARELKERADDIANKIDKNNRVFDEFLRTYRTFLLTVEFLRLLEPSKDKKTHSSNYKNYLRMYREGEDLRSVMEIIEQEEEK